MYTYIHMYPCKRWSKRVFGYDDWYLEQRLKPIMHWMRLNMNEIHWNDRLNEYNHTPHFPHFITGIVDSFPIRVQKPKTSAFRRMLFNPKYGTTIMKVEMITDFLGRIISFSGPHLGLK